MLERYKNTDFKSAAAISLVIAVVTLLGCTRDKGRLTLNCETPVSISFNKDILPIFQTNCSTSGCHTGSNPTGNLNLDANVAYISLMKKGTGYIDTVNPNYSLLYSQMISSSDQMPPSGKLDDCKTNLIFKWIQQKAKNN